MKLGDVVTLVREVVHEEIVDGEIHAVVKEVEDNALIIVEPANEAEPNLTLVVAGPRGSIEQVFSVPPLSRRVRSHEDLMKYWKPRD